MDATANQALTSQPMIGHYVSLGISIILNALSMLLLKKLSLSEHFLEAGIPEVATIVRVVLHPLFISSVFLFAGGVVTWVYALSRIDLSIAYPTVSSSYVFIAVASYLMFGERIPPSRWVGMGIIILGIVVMYRR